MIVDGIPAGSAWSARHQPPGTQGVRMNLQKVATDLDNLRVRVEATEDQLVNTNKFLVILLDKLDIEEAEKEALAQLLEIKIVEVEESRIVIKKYDKTIQDLLNESQRKK
jgi:hypothetical protein